MERISQVVEVKVEGSLDNELLPKLLRQIREALELHPRVLCVDLMDCLAVHERSWVLLRAASAEAREQGTRLTVRGGAVLQRTVGGLTGIAGTEARPKGPVPVT